MPNGKIISNVSKENKGDISKIRSHIFRVVLYPDNPDHMLAIMQLQSLEFPAVGIKHDKDVYTDDTDDHKAGEIEKEHFHFVVRYKNAHYLVSFAKSLGIDPRFVKTGNSYKGCVRYLLHLDDPDKYQYERSELVGFSVPEALKLLDDEPQELKAFRIRDFIYHYNGYLEDDTLFVWCYTNGVLNVLNRYRGLLEKLVYQHNKRYFDETHR